MPAEAPTDYRFGDRMTDLEAMMWGLERLDPTFRSTMRLVVSFDGEPDRMRVLDRLEAGLESRPALARPHGGRTLADGSSALGAGSRLSGRQSSAGGYGGGCEHTQRSVRGRRCPGRGPVRPGPPALAALLRRGREGRHTGPDPRAASQLYGRPWRGEAGAGAVRPGAVAIRVSDPFLRARMSVTPATDTTRLAQDLEFGARHSAEIVGRVLPWAVQVLRQAVRDPVPPAATTLPGSPHPPRASRS